MNSFFNPNFDIYFNPNFETFFYSNFEIFLENNGLWKKLLNNPNFEYHQQRMFLHPRSLLFNPMTKNHQFLYKGTFGQYLFFWCLPQFWAQKTFLAFYLVTLMSFVFHPILMKLCNIVKFYHILNQFTHVTYIFICFSDFDIFFNQNARTNTF